MPLKVKIDFPKLLVVGFLAAAAAIIVTRMLPQPTNKGAAASGVIVPTLSAEASEGQSLFAANCARCHGVNGSGTDHGPPLIHEIYNSGHHSDKSFYFAAANGVRQHHWPFGDMLPQTQVQPADVEKIISFVREVQIANGITYKPHTM